MKAAVFLDRDGTVNEQMGYINHISRLRLLPRAAAAIRLLNETGLPVVVVTNQSGVARGYFPLHLLDEVHERMAALLAREGAHIDGLYVCPHHPRAEIPELRLPCRCRKPGTAMLEKAAEKLGLDLARSYVVGDRWSDLMTAANCGAKGILVLTGYGRGELEYVGPRQRLRPHHVADDLYEAVRWIIADLAAGPTTIQQGRQSPDNPEAL